MNARCWIVAALLPAAVLAPYVATAVSSGGDETGYLLNVESLRADGDLDVRNNVARGDAAAYYWGPPPTEPWSRSFPGVAALLLPGYALGATGAGDVKLMAAVGAIVGPALVLSAFICTSLAGGVLAIAVAIRRRRLASTLAQTGRLVAAPGTASQAIKAAPATSRFAYGPAIAVGSALAVLIA